MNTVKQEIRAVQYPCIIGGEGVDRIGLFLVDFDRDGEPLRAEMLRFVGYQSPADLMGFFEQVEAAIFNRETLHIHDAINLDEGEWSGTLHFPHLPILK